MLNRAEVGEAIADALEEGVRADYMHNVGAVARFLPVSRTHRCCAGGRVLWYH